MHKSIDKVKLNTLYNPRNFSEMRQMLSIIPYRFTATELGKIRTMNVNERNTLENLPEWCLNDKGQIMDARMWLQFITEGDEEYIMFDVVHTDALLHEEISNIGLEDLIEGFDYKPTLMALHPYKFEHYRRACLPESHLVFDLKYRGTGEDVELDIELVGHLNGNFELMKAELI